MVYEQNYKFSYLGKELEYNPKNVSPRNRINTKKPLINSLEFDISGSCNLNCLYCVEKITLPKRVSMSKEIWDKSLNMLFDQIKEGTPVSIHFGSGEPLLNLKAIHEISHKVQMLAKIHESPLELNLTTNGTLLTKDICNWLINHNWNIKISLDGNKRIHDKYRITNQSKGTLKLILKWIKYLLKYIPNKLIINSVLCTGTNPQDVFNYLQGLGIKKIQIIPIVGLNSSQFLLNDSDIISYRIFLENYVKKIASGSNLPLLIRLIETMKRVLGYGNYFYVCGAGRNFITVGSDGYYYPCFRFVGLEKYKIGSVNKGINSDKRFLFLRNVGKTITAREKCRTCWASFLCCGPCFANVELLGNQNGEPLQSFCDYVLNECMAAIWLVDELRDKSPEKLLNILELNLII